MPVTVLDPKLRAGSEPDTPVEDSLLRRFLVNWTASIEAHGMPAPPPTPSPRLAG